jgi:hypothetical protein
MEDSMTEQEDVEFEVELIDGRRFVRGRKEYHVKWRGYSADDSSWEPIELLSCNDLVQTFEKATNLEGK